ncbi:hypothetical protein EYM_03890 [Ignicoccus islandicus DSM 13165]|uniref:Uncharacterized protein n=1 Tax=Ignicoccus islandicus DSM 13165 TaxID=940295 RepID=A0A0U3FIH7_9CREN|nr:hypothetical protein EYM_03890 [Ignicoccus islandicus DSM 13165]
MNEVPSLRLCGIGWFKLHVNNLITNRDLIVRWDGKILRRNSKPSKQYSHIYFHTPLSLEEFLQYEPFLSTCEQIIIGSGYNGRMKVMDGVIRYLQEKGRELVISETPQAITYFVKQVNLNRKSCLIVHLTC